MLGQKKDYPWRYAWFYMAYYTANAVHQGYISKYFKDGGIEGAWLTALMAAVPLVAMFTQPFWGLRGDKANSRNRVLRGLILSAVIAIALFPLSGRWGYLLAATCLFAGCFTSIQPMGDSIVLEDLSRRGAAFGPLRLTGCLAFAVMNVLFGIILDGGRIRLAPYLTAGLLILTFLATWPLPQTAGHQAQTGRKMNITGLFQDRELPGLLILLMIIQMTMGYFYSFFPVYYTELPGGTTTLLGVCYFISATSEMPFLLNFKRLFDKLGAGKLMLIACGALLIRWVVLFLAPNAYVALMSQVLHGWGFIVITVSMSLYMTATVPDELQASGQMILAIVGFGVARVFGILGGGLISQALGGHRAGFGLMAASLVVAFAVFAPRYIKKPPLNGQKQPR